MVIDRWLKAPPSICWKSALRRTSRCFATLKRKIKNSRSTRLATEHHWCGIIRTRAVVNRPTSPSCTAARAWISRTCRPQPIGSQRFDQVTRRSFPAGNLRPTWLCIRHFAVEASRVEAGSIPSGAQHPSLVCPSWLPWRQATVSTNLTLTSVCEHTNTLLFRGRTGHGHLGNGPRAVTQGQI